MNTRKLKFLDHPTLARLNAGSIRSGRLQHLPEGALAGPPQTRYPINLAIPRARDGRQEVRVSVVLDLAGQSAWLDITPEEFNAIPEIEVLFDVYEGIMCAGNPPPAP
ncbi:MAG: hypothetical protein HY681_14690 [Chloroflexi bacterium]|nr:hypothetical protein [Chloroflexota bacterium]